MKKKLISYNVRVDRYITNKLRSIIPPALDMTVAGVLVVNLLSCMRKDTRLVYSRDNTRKKQTEMYYHLYNRKRVSAYKLVKVVDWMCANGWCYGSAGSRGDYPTGVSLRKRTGKYRAQCNNPLIGEQEHLGYFSTPEEAHEAWRKRKHELAQLVAARESDPRVVAALKKRYSIDEWYC